MNIPFEVETARNAVHFVLAMLVVIGLGIWVSRNEDKDKDE
jgi:hypothetical protein